MESYERNEKMSSPLSIPQGIDLVADLDNWTESHTLWRDQQTINLNAATNSMSPRARHALASSLADKGISSGLRSRHHQGGQFIDAIEERIQRLTCEVFGAGAAEMRPPTGSLANALVLASLVPKNRAVMTGGENSLGHSSLREKGWSGQVTSAVLSVKYEPNGVDLDLAAIERDVAQYEPAMIVVGSQAMMFPLDLAELRRIADQVGATILYDAAHPLGLMAGGRFQNPLAEGADIVTASTQKSLPGPVGGVILTRTPELMEPIYTASNQLMSNYQNNRVLSVGYTIAEMACFGEAYATACIANARTLASELAGVGLEPLFRERGFTNSNLFLLPWDSHEAAHSFARRCESVNLIVSTTRLPSTSNEPPKFGTRIGVQDVTRHGFGSEQLVELAQLLACIARGANSAEVAKRMTTLAAEFSTIFYCFENRLPAMNAISAGLTDVRP